MQVRLGRVQAAAERRRQAEADGDFVQLTHTDSLTQACPSLPPLY